MQVNILSPSLRMETRAIYLTDHFIYQVNIMVRRQANSMQIQENHPWE
jgi:hypothetical protein